MLRRIELLVSRFSAHPKQIFIVDALGATLSAILAATIAHTENVFGMPAAVLNLLAIIAAVFALYSFVCSAYSSSRWRIFLGVIVAANTLYCLTTVASLLYFFQQLTFVGMLYFSGELIVVACLVSLELRVILKR